MNDTETLHVLSQMSLLPAISCPLLCCTLLENIYLQGFTLFSLLEDVLFFEVLEIFIGFVYIPVDDIGVVKR